MASISHKKKRKGRHQSSTIVEESVPSSPKKVKVEEKTSSIVENTVADDSSKATLGWPTDDLNTLINNLAKCLPKNDSAKYSTLIEKLDFDKVKFSQYSAQDCKDKWFEVMNRLRRYRTLTDMVSDARVWLKAPWQTYNNSRKVKHPDLPKKPLTPFFRYFMEKREKAGKSHPGASVTDLAKLLSVKFAALNDRKKQKYKDGYDREYEEYKLKIEQFKKDHPEVEFGSMNKTQSSHGHAQEGPPKPKTPSQLYMEEKSKKIPAKSEGRKEAIDRIKQSWNQLSEGKRIKWIRKSLQDELRYEAELLEYLKDHPSFEPNKSKSVLTKNEKELKDKFDGKPERPPNSGYSLFSKILLKELKDIPSKEKMVVIAKRWKELSDTDRQGYNREAQKMNTKYVEKFNLYLDSLPESEKEKVLSENKLKLPSEKKLKQLQTLPKLQTPLNPEHVEDPNARETAALMNYQLDRCPVLSEKYPEKNRSEIMKIVFQEWKDKVSDKKKAKYYKAAESFAQLMPSSKTESSSPPKKSNVKEKPSALAQELLKREPKKPPKSGYALFTAEQLSSLTNFEPKKRMQEIARKWNQELTKEDKENYDKRIKQMSAEYQKQILKFTSTLSPTELTEYKVITNERSRPKGRSRSKSVKSEPDPVVDDSNVINTIDVATTGNIANDSDDSDDDSDEESDNEKKGEEEDEEDEEEQGEGEGDDEEEDQDEEEGEEEEEEESEEGEDEEDSSD